MAPNSWENGLLIHYSKMQMNKMNCSALYKRISRLWCNPNSKVSSYFPSFLVCARTNFEIVHPFEIPKTMTIFYEGIGEEAGENWGHLWMHEIPSVPLSRSSEQPSFVWFRALLLLFPRESFQSIANPRRKFSIGNITTRSFLRLAFFQSISEAIIDR